MYLEKIMIKIVISIISATFLLVANNSFEVTLSKYRVYPSEVIVMTGTLHYDTPEVPNGIEIDKLSIDGAKIYKLPTLENNSTHEIIYRNIIIPQHSGILNIPIQKIYIPHKNPKTYMKVWEVLESKPAKIEILKMPNDILATGNYSISSKIEQNSTKPNDPIRLNIKIKGTGDLRNSKGISLDIKDVTIFDSKPTIKSKIDNNAHLHSTLMQQFVIISDHPFVIPSINFKYLNSDTQLVETLSTKRYKVNIKTDFLTKERINYILFAFGGFLLGSLLTLLAKRSFGSLRYRSSPLSKKIIQSKNDKELYKLLLPFSNNKNISKAMHLLEENIYQNKGHKINRKEIAKAIMDLNPDIKK